MNRVKSLGQLLCVVCDTFSEKCCRYRFSSGVARSLRQFPRAVVYLTTNDFYYN
jgi:hypothetical protein